MQRFLNILKGFLATSALVVYVYLVWLLWSSLFTWVGANL